MDLDKNEEEDENDFPNDQSSLFPEISDQQPEELDLEFLPAQERPLDPPPLSYEREASAALPTAQRAPLPPPRPRSRRTPAGYYHPNDYYLGTDWPRVIVGSLVSLLILGGVVLLAIYLFEKFDEGDSAPTVLPSIICYLQGL